MNTWRLLIDPPQSAAHNMAVDEALAASCRAEATAPTLRLYAWERPSISLGYFQRPDEIVDLDRCRDAGVPVVVRTTGGRAVYHHDEVTYSLVAPIHHPLFPPTIKGTFAAVARALAAGLAELGVAVDTWTDDRGGAARPQAGARSPFCFESVSWYEITLGGKKLIGSAQRRWKTAFLQHGSLLLTYEPEAAAPWFRAASGSPATHRVTGLNIDGRSFTRDDVCRALVVGWERAFDIRLAPGALTEAEAAFVAETSHSRDLAVTLVR
ncbi:MAG: lipoate--protein ligase family protein [Nitrospirae bacterium]|nr:lipoate--protein ligase family protein [Nitrospirota bacterium]